METLPLSRLRTCADGRTKYVSVNAFLPECVQHDPHDGSALQDAMATNILIASL